MDSLHTTFGWDMAERMHELRDVWDRAVDAWRARRRAVRDIAHSSESARLNGYFFFFTHTEKMTMIPNACFKNRQYDDSAHGVNGVGAFKKTREFCTGLNPEKAQSRVSQGFLGRVWGRGTERRTIADSSSCCSLLFCFLFLFLFYLWVCAWRFSPVRLRAGLTSIETLQCLERGHGVPVLLRLKMAVRLHSLPWASQHQFVRQGATKGKQTYIWGTERREGCKNASTWVKTTWI